MPLFAKASQCFWHPAIMRSKPRTMDWKDFAQMKETLPDIVISDLNMPRMSGYEFLSVIRGRFPQVPSVAMSGAHKGPSVPAGVAAHAFFRKGENVLRAADNCGGPH